jgi:hypothetical protein
MPVINTTQQLPGLLNLQMYQGGTYVLSLTWTDDSGTPVDLVGYSGSFTAVYSNGNLIIQATTADGLLVLGGALGTIVLTIPATTTSAFSPGGGQYALLLTSGSGVVYPLVTGAVTIQAAIVG